MAGDHVAVDALGFLGEPLDEARAIGDLALGLGQGLALLGGHDGGQVLLILHHQVEPLAQDGGALLGGHGAPGRPGGVRRLDGATGLVGAHVGNGAEHLARRGVRHLDRLAGIGVGPFPVDVALLPEQALVLDREPVRRLTDGLLHGVTSRNADENREI